MTSCLHVGAADILAFEEQAHEGREGAESRPVCGLAPRLWRCPLRPPLFWRRGPPPRGRPSPDPGGPPPARTWNPQRSARESSASFSQLGPKCRQPTTHHTTHRPALSGGASSTGEAPLAHLIYPASLHARARASNGFRLPLRDLRRCSLGAIDGYEAAPKRAHVSRQACNATKPAGGAEAI